MKNNILITGGAGYIGSNIAFHLLKTENKITILDDLSRSDLKNINILNKKFNCNFNFYQANIQNSVEVKKIFKKHDINLVIHLAGYKSIVESIKNPSLYNHNNFEATKIFFKTMLDCRCTRIIFSSSASVYGNPEYLPVDERHNINPTNPYAKSKADIEKFLLDEFTVNPLFNCIILRYFNPIGSSDGLLGEGHELGVNNIMSEILRVALGKKNKLEIYGNNFNTKDGTGIRDYIHISDLANAHIHSIDYTNGDPKINIYNIGCGRGFSVLDLIKAFKNKNNIDIPYIFAPRRDGDAGKVFADVNKFMSLTNWEPKKNLDDMCEDAWAYEILKK